jgi:hypothetical protein
MRDTESFWLESPTVLFREMKIIPKEVMSLAEQMNALTRLVILFFGVLYLTGFKDALLFLLMSLIFIIILYYLQKKSMSSCENYVPEQNSLPSHASAKASALFPKPPVPYQPRQFSSVPLPPDQVAMQNYVAKTDHLMQEYQERPRTNYLNHPSYYNVQIAKAVEVNNDQTYTSNNQKLVGGANPKTKIRPIVAPPSYEWSCWRENDFVLPPQINTRSVQDYYSSGYYVDEPPVAMNKDMREMSSQPYRGFSSSSSSTGSSRKSGKQDIHSKVSAIVENYEDEVRPVDRSNFYFRSDQKGSGQSNSCKKDECSYREFGVTPLDRENGDFLEMKRRKQPLKTTGDLDDSLGYDPSNLDYDWPSNYPAANCRRSKEMKNANGQLFTSTVVPGVYYKNQIIEPISSNIGISFDQQIPARKVTKDQYGNVIYEARDPRLYEPEEDQEPPRSSVPSVYDVYDPRYDGYGTQERSYVDKLTGQPRFYYDDVNAIRRPNYVMRSNIDFLGDDVADSYGPIVDSQTECGLNERVRLAADQSYTDNALDFRTEMMTRLMRKRNAELWQNRLAPKTTMKK